MGNNERVTCEQQKRASVPGKGAALTMRRRNTLYLRETPGAKKTTTSSFVMLSEATVQLPLHTLSVHRMLRPPPPAVAAATAVHVYAETQHTTTTKTA